MRTRRLFLPDNRSHRLGLQIAGRPFHEVTALRVGEASQRMTDWHLMVPPMAELATARV